MAAGCGVELFERQPEQRGAVVKLVADQLGLAASGDCNEPVPVVLHFVQPALTARWLGAG